MRRSLRNEIAPDRVPPLWRDSRPQAAAPGRRPRVPAV